MEDEEDATDEADEGGLTGVLLLRRQKAKFIYLPPPSVKES